MATLLAAGCSSDGGMIGGSSSPAGTTPGGPATGATDPLTGMPIAPGTGTPGTAPTDPMTGLPIAPAPSTGGTSPVNTALPTATTPATAGTGNVQPPTPPGGCEAGVPATSQIPRLTNAQYNRTIADLLGTAPPNLLATEQAGGITNGIWDGYQLTADGVAAQVMADPTLKANFMKCTPTGDGAACLSETIEEFGRRAYRRPLTADEIAGFEGLVARGAELTETGSVDEVAELLLSTFLKMPSFLQRAEVAEGSAEGGFKLSSHEVAARLSYMLWGTMPDDTLSAAADADALQSKEQVLQQAQRMVADEKAREVAAEFHRTYLQLSFGSRWDSAKKDQELFPAFTDNVVPDMINETEMLFDGIYANGGSFQDLLTTNVGYVTSNTAALYGLDPALYTATPTEVTLEGRPGFLTRIGFLAAYSAQTRTSPILRGSFITKHVLGVDPGAPDPAAINAPLPMDPAYDTNRKRVAAQTGAAGCVGCHAPYINPPGFVMEAFNSAGAVQTIEQGTEAPIDTTAEVSFAFGATPVPVANPSELMAQIAVSAEAQRFYSARWVSFAYERQLTGPDECVVDALSANAAGGASIQNLLAELTQSDSFLVRALEVTQ